MPITLICLDADDTLWHNETYFRRTFGDFSGLLAPFASPEKVQAHLDRVEHRNLSVYGYGVKGFILSMMEVAAEIAGDDLPAATMRDILALGRDQLVHPIEMLPGVEDALPQLAERGRLILVTKGDLHHQEAKLAASGIGDLFEGVEIVSEKETETYRRIFRRYRAFPEQAVMAGNSMRSDILPALDAGAYAAFVPFELVWAHEAAEAPVDHPRYRALASLAELPDWLDRLA
ncbi:HAD family hydrolase [Sphingosinicella sp. BN140058]|uniref:HAD family hydrolase n=1 Tax=Sphingosinicella sp. BN140058 TaxID=1892855 RepID=UPI001013A21F|nr:HAD family hydrolase [Sphingosinicella sp. BN140058]QAY79028.1 HAD family hydrolase [Sphingosinicella sp. BN140058]